jgi:hypothetical protein
MTAGRVEFCCELQSILRRLWPLPYRERQSIRLIFVDLGKKTGDIVMPSQSCVRICGKVLGKIGEAAVEFTNSVIVPWMESPWRDPGFVKISPKVIAEASVVSALAADRVPTAVPQKTTLRPLRR